MAAIIIRNRKILLVTGYGGTVYWTPGGKMEEDESREACLRRELFEELGIRVKEMAYYTSYETRKGIKGRQKSRCYFVRHSGTIRPKGEITKILWYSRGDFIVGKPRLFSGIGQNLIPKLISDGYL